MADEIESAPPDHPHQLVEIGQHDPLQVAAQMQAYMLAENFRPGVYIDNLALRRVQQVHRSDPVVQR